MCEAGHMYRISATFNLRFYLVGERLMTCHIERGLTCSNIYLTSIICNDTTVFLCNVFILPDYPDVMPIYSHDHPIVSLKDPSICFRTVLLW